MRNLVAACLVLAASIAQADSSVPQPGSASALLASLERTACYGRCPIYTVTVLRDGTVLWEGRRFVKVTGKATAKLPAATVTALADAFKKAGFFAFADRYERYDITDHPSALTSYSDGTRNKTVHHYHGDQSAPAALDELERRIDELVGTARWIGKER